MRRSWTFCLLLLGACKVGPDYSRPELTASAAFAAADEHGLAAAPADLADWWQRLEDPVLDGLVQRALAANLELRSAGLRVAEARAQRAVAAGGRWPTLDAGASYRRSGRSDQTDLGNFGVLRDDDLFRLGLDAAWEVDLWGRIARGVEAADADLGAAVADAQAALVTVLAETALAYVDLRAAQQRLRIAEQNVELQQATVDLVQSRLRAGLVSERELAQAAANLATTRARLPTHEVAARAAEHRLAVLLGQPPGGLAAELRQPAPIPVAPVAVAVGVPADTLHRRPDVAAAERRLAAETARVGVVEADRYPRLQLLGSVGLEARRVADLFRSGAGVFSVGPSVSWSLFDGGRRTAQVAVQDARMRQAALLLEATVLGALEEVENAIAAFLREQVRRESLRTAAEQAGAAVRLSDREYRQGLADFQTVLDAQRQQAAAEDELVQSDAAVTAGLVRLYRALGGGWEHVAAPALAAGAVPERASGDRDGL